MQTWASCWYKPFDYAAIDKMMCLCHRLWPTETFGWYRTSCFVWEVAQHVILEIGTGRRHGKVNPEREQKLLMWGATFYWIYFTMILPMFFINFLPCILLTIAHSLGLLTALGNAFPIMQVPFATLFTRALVLSLWTDTVSNINSFMVVVCNHSGSDLWLYTSSCRPYTAEWFLRSIHSSANFPCGDDFTDLNHGWLNYQIEHHMFPDLSPLQYRKIQPLVKEICKKYGIPYIQDTCFKRFWSLLEIGTGMASMPTCTACLEIEAEESGASGK